MNKILFFIGTLDDGGAQRVVSILSNKLVEEKYEVEILKYYKGNNIYPLLDDVKVNSVEEYTNSKNIIKNLLFIRKYFRNNYDVVISFLAPFNMLAIFANLFNKVPMIVADRNDPNKIPSNVVVRKLRDLLYRFADGVVLQTNHNKEYFNYIKDKCTVIPNPIDFKENAGIALKTRKKNKIVTVGRLMPQKNQLMLIDSFNEFLKKHSEYQLVIYGEGPYRETLENRIKELNIENNVLLFGSTNNVFDEIKDAKIFVMTSNYEGMPNALIEAMCLGLPVISTKVSGADDLIINGENGYLIDLNDKEKLVEKMNYIIENNEITKSFGEEAVKLNDELNLNSVFNKWIDFIKHIVVKYNKRVSC